MAQKVLFVYPNLLKSVQEQLGIAYLAGQCQRAGMKTFLFDYTFDPVEQLDEMVKDIQPDVVAFSCRNNDFSFACELARRIRPFTSAPLVFGGPHVTLDPEDCIKPEEVDVLLVGEVEPQFVEFIQTKNYAIKGLWYKKDGKVVRNPPAPFPDVNSLAWPDHGMFERHFSKEIYETTGRLGTFLTARGCPFDCTYCANHRLRTKQEGRWTRFRDVKDVIAEMKAAMEKYNLTHILISDDTFTVLKSRVIEFCKLYKEEVNLPWYCMIRPNTVNFEVFQAMAAANAQVVGMGIESGSDRVANKILKRALQRETIVRAFKDAHRAGLRTLSYNMIGLPTETREEALETIGLNKECEVDYPRMTIFTAFPGTDLWDFCVAEGTITEDMPVNYYEGTNIKHKNMTLTDIKSLRKQFLKETGGLAW